MVCSEAEADDKITAHKNDADAHHAKLHATTHAAGGADEITDLLNPAAIPPYSIPFRDVSVDTDSDFIDLTGLDLNAHKCYMLSLNLVNPTTSGSNYFIYVEADYTNTNYYNQGLFIAGTEISAGRDNNPLLGYLPAGERGAIIIFVWRDPSGYFRYLDKMVRQTGNVVTNASYTGTKTATVTNVTQIRISADVAGGIGAGSRVMLFRLGG